MKVCETALWCDTVLWKEFLSQISVVYVLLKFEQ
jgi:hypothetical protein